MSKTETDLFLSGLRESESTFSRQHAILLASLEDDVLITARLMTENWHNEHGRLGEIIQIEVVGVEAQAAAVNQTEESDTTPQRRMPPVLAGVFPGYKRTN